MIVTVTVMMIVVMAVIMLVLVLVIMSVLVLVIMPVLVLVIMPVLVLVIMSVLVLVIMSVLVLVIMRVLVIMPVLVAVFVAVAVIMRGFAPLGSPTTAAVVAIAIAIAIKCLLCQCRLYHFTVVIFSVTLGRQQRIWRYSLRRRCCLHLTLCLEHQFKRDLTPLAAAHFGTHIQRRQDQLRLTRRTILSWKNINGINR